MADKKMYKVGLTVKEPWSPDISYEVLDITLFAVESGGDGCSYTAIKPNQGVTPGTDDTVWVKSTQAGQSIYDLAVKYHHFVGTEEEFEQQYQDALAAANNAAAAASATDEEIKANELSRVSAENGRVAAEQSRVSAEQSRVSAESARVSAESARVSAESSRESAEATRASNESARVTAENSRVSAESARVTAEQSRLQQFEALKTDMNTAIANVDAKAAEIEEDIEGYEANEAERVTAEQSRVSAESARVSAESARVTAENARVAQASSDHTRAETDHGTAESDHTTATGDHTQAGNDHIQAESDHSTAVSDHTQAEADHTASETAAQAATEAAEAAEEAVETLDEKLADKADKDGYYGGMTVGASENLVGRGTTDAEYAGVRTSAGTADIGSGSATIARMRGRSFKWNQLFTGSNSATHGITYSYSNGIFTANGTIASSYLVFGSFGKTEVNHKYLFLFNIVKDSENRLLGNRVKFHNRSSATGEVTISSKVTPLFYTTSDSTQASAGRSVGFVGPTIASGVVWNDVQFIYEQFDLTVIFGAGNEPSTVEEFNAWRKEMGLTLDYYAYNPGEVINNRAAAIETVGFNLYDYSTGKAFLPGVYSSYPHEYEICGTFTSISFTDVNGNESVPELTDGRFFNVSAPGELTVVGGNNTDTLVHLVWSGWRNEGEPDYTYEPYWKNTLNLGLTTLKGKLNGTGDSVVVFPNGLAKIGDVRDEIVGNKAIKRIGVVDLGTQGWGRSACADDSTKYYYYTHPDSLCKVAGGLMSVLFEQGADMASVSYGSSRNRMFANTNHYIYLTNPNYNTLTSADFKTAMSGVLLYYELETPEEYTLDEPMPSQYRVDDFGTERVIPSYSPSELTAPIAYDVQYAMNAVDAIRRLDDNYVNESQIKQTVGRSETDVYSQKGVDDHYAKKVGLEENLVSGLSRNLAGKDVQTEEFATAVISGAAGLAKINEVMGKSLVWNELVVNGNFSLGSDGLDGWHLYPPSGSGSVASVSVTNGVARLQASIPAETSAQFSLNQTVNVIPIIGHKYRVRFTMRKGENSYDSVSWRFGTSTYNVRIPDDGYYVNTIITAVNEQRFWIWAYNTASETPVTYDWYYEKVSITDLTQLFGSGNEPSTVAEFESWLANNIGYRDYYAYNPGEIISNNTEALEITGLNQFDGEWEIGDISGTTGNNIEGTTTQRTVGFIPILPATNMYVYASINTVSTIRARFYDSSKQFIGVYDYNGNQVATNRAFKSPANAYYVRFAPTLAILPQGSLLCVSVSGSRDGEYEPYQKSELELNLATITGKLNGEGESVVIFPDGMRSAGTVYDSLIVDEDGWCRRAVRRISGVDMGTLTWQNATYPATEPNVPIFRAGPITGAKNSAAGIAVGYEFGMHTSLNTKDKYGVINSGYWSASNPRCAIRDTAYSTLEDFTAAINGKIVYYELATPLEYVLDTPIQMTFQAKHGGVIRQLPENGSEPTTAPMRMSVTYALDAVSILTDLPENYVSKESLQAMLSAMQSAGLFSAYTMTFNESTGKYEFTFTANA